MNKLPTGAKMSVGGALAVILVTFMPEMGYVPAPETAVSLTAAFGVVFTAVVELCYKAVDVCFKS